MTINTSSLPVLNEHDVVSFLQMHPDFFKSHGGLLADMEVPHESGRAVSLVEKQLAILRDQKRHLKKQLQELIQVARENDQLNQRIHHFTLSVLQARDLDGLVETIYGSLEKEFAVDASCLWLFDEPGEFGFEKALVCHDADHWIRKTFETIIRDVRPVCGRFRDDQLDHLFAKVAQDKVQSAALLPLYEDRPLGMLVLGAYDANRFHASKGTELLSRLGGLVSRVMGFYI